MPTLPSKEAAAVLQGQIYTWRTMFAYIDSMVLRCAVELGIADIVHAEGSQSPLSVAAIASRLSHPPPDLSKLHRVLRFLARKGVLSKRADPVSGEDFYGPTPASEWLLQGTLQEGLSLAPMILLQTSLNGESPWSKLSQCILHGGGTPHKLMHGMDLWAYTAENPETNKMFNAAMACSADIILDAVLDVYKESLAKLGSLVDVGGGTGMALAKMTNLCPKLKGVNFDLPHVIAGAPECPNVVHVGGSMFEEIPHGDAIFMKWILHNFGDEECVKVLKNCRKAIPEEEGKVILVEVVLEPEEEGAVADIGMALDMVMFAFANGKERTHEEWKELLKQGGFSRCNVIKLPAIVSIIEAFP